VSSPADVSVVVTNYNTGPYLERCVASVLDQDLGAKRCEVVAVDDASFVDQEPHLRAVEARGARVLRLPRNLGHGGACNAGLAHSSGRFVFFVNSDTVACPRAIAPLVACLETRPEVGFVEPRTFLDDDRTFCIPEVPVPSPAVAIVEMLAHVSPRLSTRLSVRQTRRSHRGWVTRTPLAVPHLTGAFLGVRRETMQRLGGYDADYPLYYEDSDLFVRARRMGLQLLLVPEAEVVHYTHRSVARTWNEAQAKARLGRSRYMRLHHGRARRWLDAWAQRVARAVAGREPHPNPAPVDMGTLTRPPTFAVGPLDGEWLLELALDPYCTLSAGRVCTGPRAEISARTWQSLYPTTYFARALEVARWRVLGAWRFAKAP